MRDADTTGATVAYLEPHCAQCTRKYRYTGKNLYMELCPHCAYRRASDEVQRLATAYIEASENIARACDELCEALTAATERAYH